ncbi:MAG: pentapeptide repeat-containing protein [Sneathiella sp.]|nr:pentapeptide repeat-containing protein [Sneathiella sp.]
MREKRTWTDHEFRSLKFPEKSVTDLVFTDCQFRSCNFSETELKNCRFENCQFTGCNLSNSKIIESRFVDVEFDGCKLMGIDWTRVSQPFDVSFHQCLLDYGNFEQQNLARIKVTECSARSLYFKECDLTHANFDGTDLRDASFENCKLGHADFSDAKNLVLELGGNNLAHAILSVETALTLLREFRIVVR